MQHLSDMFLDKMRHTGDPPADGVIRGLARTQVAAVNDLMMTLVRNDGLPPALLPPAVLTYLKQTAVVPPREAPLIRQGEELFGLYGPEMLLALGLYSLPFTYANRKGVQVIYHTAYLRDRARRRLFETMQMVIDVLQPGGLGPDGDGVRTVQKVRLMHAAIRTQILHDPTRHWDPGLGVPINQEDLAMTLMSFSYIVLDSLKALCIEVSPADQEAYLHAWTAVGRILGIVPELLPENMAEARVLTQRVFERQVGASAEAAQLTGPLIEAMASLLPSRLLYGLPASMCRHYFQHSPFAVTRVPDLLEVRAADWTRVLVRTTVEYGRLLGQLGREAPAAQLIRRVSQPICDALLRIGRGPHRAPFSIPEELQARWRRRRLRERKPWRTLRSLALGA